MTEETKRLNPDDVQILSLAVSKGVAEAMGVQPKKRRGPHFDGTVNLGHILTAVTLLLGVGAAWAAQRGTDTDQNRRLSTAEQRIQVNQTDISGLQQNYAELNATMSRIDERTSNIGEGISRLERRLEEES